MASEKETDVVIEHNGIHLTNKNWKQAELLYDLLMFVLCNMLTLNAERI